MMAADRGRRPLPAVAPFLLAAVGLVLVLGAWRPGIGVVAVVVVALLSPGRWWRWRTRRFRRGLRALRRGDPRTAREELTTFLEEIDRDPRFHRAQPFFNLGRVYPYAAAALSNLGVAELKLGDPERALRRYRAATSQAPDFVSARYGEAMALRLLKRPEDAEAAALKALEAKPSYVAARLLLALLRRARGDEAGADQALQAVRSAGQDPEELLHRLESEWGVGPGHEARPTTRTAF